MENKMKTPYLLNSKVPNRHRDVNRVRHPSEGGLLPVLRQVLALLVEKNLEVPRGTENNFPDLQAAGTSSPSLQTVVYMLELFNGPSLLS